MKCIINLIFRFISRVKPRRRKPRFRRRSAKSRDQRTRRTRNNKSANCPQQKILRNAPRGPRWKQIYYTMSQNCSLLETDVAFFKGVKQRLLITFVPSKTLPVWLKVIVFAESISRILCAFTSAHLVHVKLAHFLYNRLVRTINSFIYL